MDKKILKQYADLMGEIKDIRKRIKMKKKELEKLEHNQVADVVSGSKGELCIYGTIKIEGVQDPVIIRKQKALRKLKNLLEIKEVELLELVCEVEEYIEFITNPEIRTMFRLYYIDQLPWWRVAQQMNQIFPNRKYTEDGCRIKHARFFEENL